MGLEIGLGLGDFSVVGDGIFSVVDEDRSFSVGEVAGGVDCLAGISTATPMVASRRRMVSGLSLPVMEMEFEAI